MTITHPPLFGVVAEMTGEYREIRSAEDGIYVDLVEYPTVEVSDRTGRRWYPSVQFETLAEAEAYAEQLRFIIETEPHYHPEDDDTLGEGWPVYGSAAWTPEVAYDEACFLADAEGEPRPNWF